MIGGIGGGAQLGITTGDMSTVGERLHPREVALDKVSGLQSRALSVEFCLMAKWYFLA